MKLTKATFSANKNTTQIEAFAGTIPGTVCVTVNAKHATVFRKYEQLCGDEQKSWELAKAVLQRVYGAAKLRTCTMPKCDRHELREFGDFLRNLSESN